MTSMTRLFLLQKSRSVGGYWLLAALCLMPASASAQGTPNPYYGNPNYAAPGVNSAPQAQRIQAQRNQAQQNLSGFPFAPGRSPANQQLNQTPVAGGTMRTAGLPQGLGQGLPQQFPQQQFPQQQYPAQQPAAQPQYSQFPSAQQQSPREFPNAQAIPAQFQTPSAAQNGGPAYRVAETPSRPQSTEGLNPMDYPRLDPQQLVAQPGEHPLMPALRWAKNGLKYLEAIDGYTATMAKRERINGALGDYQYMEIKVRHRPFSVYVKLLGPDEVKGREAIYIEGQNNGNLVAHPTGVQKRLVGTISLKPTGMLAMQGNRYPITEIGVLNLTRRLIEVGEQDMQYGECEVKYFRGAKVNDRTCTCMQFIHPVPRREFRYHLARIYIDEELNLPIRYEAYNWPSTPEGEPTLTEEYTYLNLRLNPGLTDRDFDTKNPDYDY